MIINVTQDHINFGLRGMAGRCPLALAAGEICGEEVLVTHRVMSFPRNSVCIYLPQNAKDWVLSFDEDEHVEPFSFEIDIPWLEKKTWLI